MSNRSDYEEFLMFNLQELNEAVADPTHRVYCLITTIAAGGDSIVESSFDALRQAIEVPTELVIAELAFFAGMGIFRVNCDCGDYHCEINNLVDNHWYDQGKKSKASNSEEYNQIKEEILDMKLVIEA